jgi:ubiquinone/menaquinone biosynthesis C-methylase UbiE
VRYPYQGDIPRFTPIVDEGFDQRWALHPKPQATTAGIFELKTGWSPTDLAGQVVLDAGCGCGRFSEVAAGYGATVIGVDGSTHGIEAAKALVPQGTFVQADLLRLPLPDQSVDKAFSIGVLHHTADPERAFNEVARTVKPGGQLAVWLYVNPGGDQNQHVVDPEVALAAEFLHAITKACPPDKLHLICEQYAPRLRDLYNKKWGPLQQVLRVSISGDDAECVSDTFDWHCPQYRSGHTIEEVQGWFTRAGFKVDWVGNFPVSIRGIRGAP